MKISTVKASALRKVGLSAARLPKAAAPTEPVELQLLDNEDGSGALLGVTAGGNRVDISDVATLAPASVSADTSLVTVADTGGMGFKISAVGPTTSSPVAVTLSATWNDGSKGPFAYDIPVTVAVGPISGVVPVLGPATPH